MFSLFNWKRLLIEFAVLTTLLGLGYWYFTYSQNKISALTADKAALTVAVDEQKKTIKALQDFSAKQAVDIGNLQKNLATAENDKAQLEAKLAEHDLTALARAKPKLVEKYMNSASEKAIHDIVTMTGGN